MITPTRSTHSTPPHFWILGISSTFPIGLYLPNLEGPFQNVRGNRFEIFQFPVWQYGPGQMECVEQLGVESGRVFFPEVKDETNL